MRMDLSSTGFVRTRAAKITNAISIRTTAVTGRCPRKETMSDMNCYANYRQNQVCDLESLLNEAIRERDDAILLRDLLAKEADKQEADKEYNASLVEQYSKERDEARNVVARQAERIRYLEGATNHAEGTPLSRALRERDEALALLKSERETRNHIIQRGVEVERERDEARKALRDLYDWQNGEPLLSAKWVRGWNQAMAEASCVLGYDEAEAMHRAKARATGMEG